jgi:predicted ferric reductase
MLEEESVSRKATKPLLHADKAAIEMESDFDGENDDYAFENYNEEKARKTLLSKIIRNSKIPEEFGKNSGLYGKERKTLFGGARDKLLSLDIATDVLESAHNPSFWESITIYHMVFGFTLGINIVFILLATYSDLHGFNPLPSNLDKGTIALINIAFSVLARTELLLQLFYWMFTNIGKQVRSHTLKYYIARIQYQAPGGVHSGCASASMLWICFYVYTDGFSFSGSAGQTAAFIIGIIISTLLICMILLAIPVFRHRFHDAFELTHRYMGWSLIGLLWAHVHLRAYNSVSFIENDFTKNFYTALSMDPSFYLTIFVTIIVFHPWLLVRKQFVKVTVPQKNLVVIDEFQRFCSAGQFGRISCSWYGQWHPFAVISDKDSEKHSMMIARAGNWTGKQIDGEKRDFYYTRVIKAPGFMYTTRMWKKIICVASGAGIAPILPCIMQETAKQIFIIWVASNPSSFGPVLSILQRHPGRYLVHDTKTQGRPDVLGMTLRTVLKEEAEAVYIVANSELTYAIVRGCATVNIKAFGAIWDS